MQILDSLFFRLLKLHQIIAESVSQNKTHCLQPFMGQIMFWFVESVIVSVGIVLRWKKVGEKWDFNDFNIIVESFRVCQAYDGNYAWEYL